ncbi:MAG: DUF3341 domain-containing protein [Methylobacteriaceae bacterium]|nr:DUF3341 domain-containing protein [Methylobacteriaceae bacterium]
MPSLPDPPRYERGDDVGGPRGLIAEFRGADALLAASHRMRAAGYGRLEAYTPFAVEGLAEALGLRPTRLRPAMFLAGVVGAGAGLGMQVWSAVLDYPIDSGGRPLASWAAFVPVTFEMAVLFAAGAGFVGFLVGAGLPRPHHPIFAVPGFERATDDRFFLEIAGTDPKFDPSETRRLLVALGAGAIEEAPG